jgi:hypothetical protein
MYGITCYDAHFRSQCGCRRYSVRALSQILFLASRKDNTGNSQRDHRSLQTYHRGITTTTAFMRTLQPHLLKEAKSQCDGVAQVIRARPPALVERPPPVPAKRALSGQWPQGSARSRGHQNNAGQPSGACTGLSRRHGTRKSVLLARESETRSAKVFPFVATCTGHSWMILNGQRCGWS